MVPPALAFLLALGGTLAGCSNSVKPPPKPQPFDPETQLTFAPVEYDTTTFRVHFYWNGWDKDGEVIRFYFAVDADTALPITEWHTTAAKDTTFSFLVDPVLQVRKHVFAISSIDNSGRWDKTPARRAFSAKTDPPTSKITRGPAAFNPLVGPNFTFEWAGNDPDGGETGGKAPVDSFEYQLLLLQSVGAQGDDPLPLFDQTYYTTLVNAATGPTLPADFSFPPGAQPKDYSGWRWIGIHELKHRFRNATPGEYVFAERAVDIAGATERVLAFGENIRHFTVSTRNPGPTLTVTSSVLTLPLPPTMGPEDGPRKALQIFEGETISFSWAANADAYGGEMVGYTLALDDTSRFPGLNLQATGVTYTSDRLPPGNHFLYVRAVDDGGLVTNCGHSHAHRASGVQGSRGAPRDSLRRRFAVTGRSSRPRRKLPSDAEETDWWTLTLLPHLGVPITEWDTYLVGLGAWKGENRPSRGTSRATRPLSGTST
jgi:hypothetical protein